MLKRAIVSLFILALGCGTVFSATKFSMPDVMRPEMIKVHQNKLFLVEGAKISIYSLKDGKLIHSFGRAGEGPGEMKVSPIWYNAIFVTTDHIMVDSMDKLIYFSHDGKFLKETRKKINIRQIAPAGKNLVLMHQTLVENDTQFQLLSLYDSAFNKIKDLAKQKGPVQSTHKTSQLIPDILGFQVQEGKIFIEKSRQGFIIDVFDYNGKKLYTIDKGKEIKGIPITKEDAVDAENKLKQDPFIKEIGYENFKKNVSKFEVPEIFPPIKSIDVSANKIYARTFNKKKGKEETIVMDLKGNILKKSLLPPVENAPFVAHLTGIRYYTIHNGKFYFLKEDIENETWELFIEEI